MSVQWNANWPTLTLGVSFAGGGSFTDVSAYVRSCYIDRGSSRETGRYPTGTMTVTLDNRDGRFSPFNLSGPYTSGGATLVLPDIQVRLSAVWNSTTYYLFCGYAEDWQDEYAESGTDAVTVLTCVDPLAIVAAADRVADTEQGASEASSDRIERILDPLSVTYSLTPGLTSLQATTLSGNALEECYKVVDSEGGAIWYDPSASLSTFGAVVFEGRAALVTNSRSNTSQVTIGTGGIEPVEFTTSSGRDQILRSATYSNVGGTPQSTGSGLPSRVRSDLIGVGDPDALAVAQLAVAVGDPEKAPRVTSVTIMPEKDPSGTWPHALGRRIRDRVTVDVTPLVTGVQIDREVFIDGIAHAITPAEWRTSFQFASASAWDGFSASLWGSGSWGSAVWFY